MLDLPWWVADRDLAAGDAVELGATPSPTGRVPTRYTLAQAAPRGTLLGVGSDGQLHPLPKTASKTGRNPRAAPRPA